MAEVDVKTENPEKGHNAEVGGSKNTDTIAKAARIAEPVTSFVDWCRQVHRANRMPAVVLILFLNLAVGATLSTTQFTQALMAKTEFKIASYTVSTLFLVSFGLSKAVANFIVGAGSDRFGRKPFMVIGWFIGIWLPVMQICAPNWDTVVASNLFLGIQQSFTWSVCIFMLIDVSGVQHKGFAVGLSETFGYVASAIFNVVAAAMIVDKPLAQGGHYRPKPQYLVLGLMIGGFLLSFLLPETYSADAREKAKEKAAAEGQNRHIIIEWPSGRKERISPQIFVFSYTSFINSALISIVVAGILVNTITGLDWGIITQYFKGPSVGLSKDQVANGALAYGLSKGLSQFLTGFFSDLTDRKWQIMVGIFINIVGLIILLCAGRYHALQSDCYGFFVWGSVTLGFGTGVYYPVLLGAIADWAEPQWVASALGTYRFWRDLGFAIGGIIAAGVADQAGVSWAFAVIIIACGLNILQIFYFFTSPPSAVKTDTEPEGLSAAQNAEGKEEATTAV